MWQLTYLILVILLQYITMPSTNTIYQVSDCYTKLADWNEVEKWQKDITNARKLTQDTDVQRVMHLNTDMNYIKYVDHSDIGVLDMLVLLIEDVLVLVFTGMMIMCGDDVGGHGDD